MAIRANKAISGPNRLNPVRVFKPGTRPATGVGQSVTVGPLQVRKIQKRSSARMKGTSVQNRRQTPKTYI